MNMWNDQSWGGSAAGQGMYSLGQPQKLSSLGIRASKPVKISNRFEALSAEVEMPEKMKGMSRPTVYDKIVWRDDKPQHERKNKIRSKKSSKSDEYLY